MREILFRGKRVDNGEWFYGVPTIDSRGQTVIVENVFDCDEYNCRGASCLYVDENTIGQYTGLTDKNGKKIFEGDIVQYNTYDDFDCHSVVKFGEYNQDGSSGEYSATKCIGFYVEVDNFTCPDWCENDPEFFPEYFGQQNILEVASDCEVIGNIYDNPKLLLKVGDEK